MVSHVRLPFKKKTVHRRTFFYLIMLTVYCIFCHPLPTRLSVFRSLSRDIQPDYPPSFSFPSHLHFIFHMHTYLFFLSPGFPILLYSNISPPAFAHSNPLFPLIFFLTFATNFFFLFFDQNNAKSKAFLQTEQKN